MRMNWKRLIWKRLINRVDDIGLVVTLVIVVLMLVGLVLSLAGVPLP